VEAEGLGIRGQGKGVVTSYRDLTVWQKAMDLAEMIFSLTAKIPREQIYGMSAQMQRAANSVPSNIAEGHARNSTKEYLYYISVSLGSIAELETQLMLCGRVKFLSEGEVTRALGLADEVGKMLRSIQRGLKEKLN
jgi:four helix bundle protein